MSPEVLSRHVGWFDVHFSRITQDCAASALCPKTGAEGRAKEVGSVTEAVAGVRARPRHPWTGRVAGEVGEGCFLCVRKVQPTGLNRLAWRSLSEESGVTLCFWLLPLLEWHCLELEFGGDNSEFVVERVKPQTPVGTSEWICRADSWRSMGFKGVVWAQERAVGILRL